MRYTMRTGYEPVLHTYRRKNRRHSYVADRLQNYREKLLRKYQRSSSLSKLANRHYDSGAESKLLNEKVGRTANQNWYVFPRAEFQAFAGNEAKPNVDSWEGLLYQVLMPYSNNCKEAAAKKSRWMSFELMELKTDGSHFEFLVQETTIDWIVQWQDLPGISAVRQHLKKHPFPKDKCYSEEEFLNDVKAAAGYIHLFVEKRQTAEFIRDLICELF